MNLEGKNALVTGGCGFIGSHLAEALIKRGVEVTVIDLVSKQGTQNLEKLKSKITILDFDIKNHHKRKLLDKNFDFIFHLAACAAPKMCEKNPEIAIKTNILGTFNMLKFASKIDIKKFLFPSSALLYGRYPKRLPIDENHPISALENVYNMTKKLGEDLCNLFLETYDLPVIYFRLFNTFGPRQTSDYFIPTVILQAMHKKVVELWSDKPTRDFTFVNDTVEAFIKGAKSKFCGGPINIGSGREMKIKDITTQIASKFNCEVKFLNKNVSGSLRLCCDNSKAKKILGWKPNVSFEEGLSRTIKWYKNSSFK